jgi:AcrR family transcriptional regulator
MSTLKKKSQKPARIPRARNAHSRQRQRLIDACISALHIYGPSRTTVEKVVAIARMSPGIVRFYFACKAAMLVASLQFLAAEFEEQLLVPVTRLKSRPVAALELMVDLYLDPEIASPRKVSVWYAFWGEASSRQEYYDICGQKDESFASLVRELIERLIIETAQALKDGLSERAMQIHLQRIVGAYVGSAHGAGQFYSRAVTEARGRADLDQSLDPQSAAHRRATIHTNPPSCGNNANRTSDNIATSSLLGFAHPATGEELTFESEPPPDMAALIAALKRK